MRTIDADHLLHEIAELQKSPWYNTGKEFDPNFPHMHIGYLERKEAVEIVRDLCIKQEPTIQPDAPRVMTLEEAQNAEIVWIEQVGTIVPAIRVETLSKSGTIIFAYTHDCGVLVYVNIKPEHYGKVLRCWTASPTAERRDATPWDE